MNTLAANFSDYDAGTVTRAGFLALSDAESYDQITAICAASSCLQRLLASLERGAVLHLYQPDGSMLATTNISDFEAWAMSHFPLSLANLRRDGSL